jgi:hypothetical protein
MMHNDDYFIPETVDEQVERILLMPDTPETVFPPTVSLVQELNAICEEDAALLERVWERYSARINAQPAHIIQPQKLPLQKKEHTIMYTLEDKNATIFVSPPHKRKR